MGAKITGAGSKTINIEGVNSFAECEHKILHDRIVAGTYIISRSNGK